ncbi:DUF3577 domain-containing protein [Klebsiella variicola subsp. variicola]|nr:DUF3577 domain-containing protein [Klebsiella variicola subsp. variicola]
MPVTAPSTLIPFLSTSGVSHGNLNAPLRRTLPCKLTVWTISVASATCTPKKGDSFLACAIAALNGPTTKPEYRYFDIRVSGDEA